MKSSYQRPREGSSGQYVARRGSVSIAAATSLSALQAELRAKKIPYSKVIVIGFLPPKGVVSVYSFSVN